MADDPTWKRLDADDAAAMGYPLRDEWPAGPWDDEPDELAWSFGDVACRIVRHPRWGSLNGYVGIPPSHPWYGLEMNEVDVEDVHCGITWAGPFQIETYATATDALWWVGFDCNHFMDAAPGMIALEAKMGLVTRSEFMGTYRDLAYVRREVEKLAREAIQAMRR